MRVAALVIVLVAIASGIAAAMAILAQSGTTQPYGNELSDNVIFARSIPFVLAIGVAFGMLAASLQRGNSDTKPGHVRRFSRATVLGHWAITLGFVLALPTGVWQYLGGIIDKSAPIPLYLIYRIHYVGAAIILAVLAYFLVYWWITRRRELLVPRGEWKSHLSAFALELPPRLGRMVARVLRLQPGGAATTPGQFSFYETAFSFPVWTFALTLITVTGLVKALRYLIEVPGPILWGASTLHVAAMVLLVLKVLDHMRYVFARWPLMAAMTTTWITERYARAHFPGWRQRSDKSEAA
jgi:cytochrome b subunit of formate dehydrogenase